MPALIGNQSQPVTQRHQAFVAVVLAQQQPVFRAGGEHPVGLVGAAGHQIIDQHADVGLSAAEHDAGFTVQSQAGIDAGHDALRGSLFIAGGAVDLAGQPESLDPPAFQGGCEFRGVDEIVLDGIGVTHDPRLFQPGNAVHDPLLHLRRQGGGNAVHVALKGVQALGFDEDLVALALGEFDHLVLDGGAVAGSDTLDDPAVK